MKKTEKRGMIAVLVSGFAFIGFTTGCENPSSGQSVSTHALEQSKRLTIDERVKRIVAEQLGVQEARVTQEARFAEDLGADSLDAVELIMAIEEEFEIEINDADAMKIKTVAGAIEFLQKAANK